MMLTIVHVYRALSPCRAAFSALLGLYLNFAESYELRDRTVPLLTSSPPCSCALGAAVSPRPLSLLFQVHLPC